MDQCANLPQNATSNPWSCLIGMDATKLTDSQLRRTLRNYLASTKGQAWWGQANPAILAALQAECRKRGMKVA